MSDTAAGIQRAPLEDLMVAMDVVDTIRHRQLIVDRELDAEKRRERMLERLREIYRAQGIDVTDAALEAGVDALEEERFTYKPTPAGFSTTLAHLYVSRGRWLKPLLAAALLGLAIWLFWYFSVALPEAERNAALPNAIENTYARIVSISASDEATQRSAALRAQSRSAIAGGNTAAAEETLAQLEALLGDLEQSYEIRIVSRPGELSGVWRIPDINPGTRNFYLIVEAIGPAGTVLPLRVRNEEDGRVRQVSTWGVRVGEDVFNLVAADKRDDGIIQDFVIGRKDSGKLEPVYDVDTSGATITEW